jgi:TIR domain-containing protein
MESGSTRAVFLSYARENTEAARRIADALRSHGVEVWFDQNDLRGGDAWDQKIRRQIGECALFIPIVSEHTQARGKGYFRLEWADPGHCNRRGQAISVLREIIANPIIIRTPRLFRLDPIWSRLSGDPQFDQILDSAKPI